MRNCKAMHISPNLLFWFKNEPIIYFHPAVRREYETIFIRTALQWSEIRTHTPKLSDVSSLLQHLSLLQPAVNGFRLLN